ncbi:uncharacterized protein LOC122505298 isoform X1 [Leptopilina heterotoma]|uniref:uncharacterized protein LOC122505298 isoform X1 n=1 Tax=Leptopilina heterotoma TaxID=63436 RepID=UPI001CAA063E|nr:uncharacterized protein LOC122505298 isoform X1 [Leptopilina heterotoma]
MLTYVLSTDGAPPFNMSKRSFWPLQVILNFLPPHLRFKYVLLVGIMIVRHEPKPDLMNLFIKKFVEQTKHLQSEGIQVKVPHHDKYILLRFGPVCVVADSKARCVLQNRFQYNAYCSCSYCYHMAKYFYGAGIRFPFLEKEPELRTHETHLTDVKDVLKLGSSSVLGVKGESAFLDNPIIDMVWGFPLDYVHNAVLGVIVQMWNNWNKEYLVPAERREVDKLLLQIQPPRDLHRVTEKISDKSLWKAMHWKSWLLYYCLPIMSKFLPLELVEKCALFVNSIKTLLQIKITEAELAKCEEDLLIFVGDYNALYGDNNMTFNVHILLHAVQSVRMTGPLWSTSAFPFEHNIFCLKNTMNGQKSIEQQMSSKSLKLLSYKLEPQNPNVSSIVQEYCKNIFNSKTVTDSAFTFDNYTFFGPHLKNKFQKELEFDRCIINNRIYCSTKYNRSKKFNDTIVILRNGTIAQITGIKVINGVKK